MRQQGARNDHVLENDLEPTMCVCAAEHDALGVPAELAPADGFIVSTAAGPYTHKLVVHVTAYCMSLYMPQL
jgi:hypothetical protein